MGGIEGKEGVLKLVHPGRYVEIHKEPLTAAHVLKKNPRHSVTRPDVFQNQSSKSYEHRHLLEQTSPSKSSAGGTPKHQDHCQSDWQQFEATCWEEASPQEQAFGERFNRPSQFEPLADMITKYQSTYKEFKQMSVTDPTSDTVDKEYHFSEVSSNKAAASKQDDGLGTECKKQVTILKPCLRKQDSARKLLHRKVSFFLPTKGEERKRKVNV
ncbi:hypothetical protein REPUB_Repub17cG0061700 [Reevesia pubescens]